MTRIGVGYDLHPLVADRRLVLGGVHVPFDQGLAGHSDADALVHAVIDALLGAAALGNIGRLFPDTDPRYAGADSLALLRATAGRVSEAGYAVVNIDANIVAERPRLEPYLDTMRHNVAQCLSILESAVSIKAKTNEGLGPEGRGEAVSAHAVVLLEMRGARA